MASRPPQAWPHPGGLAGRPFEAPLGEGVVLHQPRGPAQGTGDSGAGPCCATSSLQAQGLGVQAARGRAVPPRLGSDSAAAPGSGELPRPSSKGSKGSREVPATPGEGEGREEVGQEEAEAAE